MPTDSRLTWSLHKPSPGDTYPSRVQPEPEIYPRLDPIVYGDSGTGPLPDEQLRQYEATGFLVLPGFLPDKAGDACRAELSRLCDSPEICQRPEAILEPEGDELRSLFSIHKHDISPLLSRIASDSRLTGIAMQILGSEISIHQSRVNLKPGFAGQEFYWHSDFETWHVEDGMPRMRAVSCSVFLTENTELNGPLMLIPRSHRYFVACVGETPDNHYQTSLRRQEYGVPDNQVLQGLFEQGGITAATGPPGTVVFFDCNTMHGSNSNITPLSRSNLFFVYNSTSNRIREPFCGKRQRPEYIAAREHVEPLQQTSLNIPSRSTHPD